VQMQHKQTTDTGVELGMRFAEKMLATIVSKQGECVEQALVSE